MAAPALQISPSLDAHGVIRQGSVSLMQPPAAEPTAAPQENPEAKRVKELEQQLLELQRAAAQSREALAAPQE
jgi:hypothetical protein